MSAQFDKATNFSVRIHLIDLKRLYTPKAALTFESNLVKINQNKYDTSLK